MAQHQVLEDEVLARTNRRQYGREQQPEQFEHSSKITDLRSREVLPLHNASPIYDRMRFCRPTG
ncbi:MAG: hypothetical protein M3069_20725, partial [Chloroflexota bacterium]|nr:hypothetical protein [Chloroflexota bacterium]